jgi:CheY-like chemotaxis protein
MSHQQASTAKNADGSILILGDVLGALRHDIRANLGVILGGASLMASAGTASEPLKIDVFHNMVKRGAKNLDRLLADITDYCRAKNGSLPWSPELVRSDLLLDQIEKECADFLAGRSLDLKVISYGHPTEISCDPRVLTQVVRCFLAAAAVRMAKGTIEVSLNSSDFSCLDVTVRDDGPAVSAKYAVKSQMGESTGFTPSYQSESVTSGFYRDLAISIIDGLGEGWAWQQSHSDGFNVISLQCLPEKIGFSHSQGVHSEVKGTSAAMGTSEGDLIVAAAVNSHRLMGLKILVADDSNDNQLLMRHLLATEGARIDTGANGEDVLALAKQTTYDLVLMDLNMPVMDGHKATVALRKNGYKGPIIGLSAHVSDDDLQACVSEGFSRCIERPVDRADLVNHILRELKHRVSS